MEIDDDYDNVDFRSSLNTNQESMKENAKRDVAQPDQHLHKQIESFSLSPSSMSSAESSSVSYMSSTNIDKAVVEPEVNSVEVNSICV